MCIIKCETNYCQFIRHISLLYGRNIHKKTLFLNGKDPLICKFKILIDGSLLRSFMIIQVKNHRKERKGWYLTSFKYLIYNGVILYIDLLNSVLLIYEEATQVMVKLTCPRSTSHTALAGNRTPVAEFTSHIEYHYTTDPFTGIVKEFNFKDCTNPYY